jgi:decaprenylphospho-beta-D-erythro-pentofuranosid-2-ulose 2-reductase
MERVLILGATSSIAAEVAALHGQRGARLHLVGRNAEKLARVAERATVAGGTVTTEVADFDDLSGAEALIDRAWTALTTIHQVLIAHGELGDQIATEKEFAAAEAILRTNFLSVVALLVPIANHLERQGTGRLGVITSVAGDRGRPRNYTYGAAKGALGIYLQGVRTRLYPKVSVTTLKLGPVDTPMTKDHSKHALFGKPAKVAADIVTAMDQKVPEAYVPRFWQAIMPVVKHTPEALFQKLGFLSGR